MIYVKHYDGKGKLICERKFKTDADVSRFYGNKKHPDLPEPPVDGCWNCLEYDPSAGCCMKEWNNLDPMYYIPERDNKEPDDYCDDHELDINAEYDGFGGNEP